MQARVRTPQPTRHSPLMRSHTSNNDVLTVIAPTHTPVLNGTYGSLPLLRKWMMLVAAAVAHLSSASSTSPTKMRDAPRLPHCDPLQYNAHET